MLCKGRCELAHPLLLRVGLRTGAVADGEDGGGLSAAVYVLEEAAEGLVVAPLGVVSRVLAQRELPEAAADLVATLAHLTRWDQQKN